MSRGWFPEFHSWGGGRAKEEEGGRVPQGEGGAGVEGKGVGGVRWCPLHWSSGHWGLLCRVPVHVTRLPSCSRLGDFSRKGPALPTYSPESVREADR